MTELRSEIAANVYLVVGYGEGYDAKVVDGVQLVNQWCKILYGCPLEEAEDEEVSEDVQALNEEDNWSHDSETGCKFTHYEQDIGENGHIEIWRVTNTP